MARQVSIGTRAELLGLVGERYRSSGHGERSRILDEFIAVTSYHRKHRGPGMGTPSGKPW